MIDHGERHDEKPEERDTEKKERPHLSSRMQYNRGLMPDKPDGLSLMGSSTASHRISIRVELSLSLSLPLSLRTSKSFT